MQAWLCTDSRPWRRRCLEEAGHQFHLGAFITTTRRPPMITPDQFRFFLDSGAYSAWSRGTKIDLDEYCEFIKANIELIDVYASLDVIPGAPGRPASPKERDEAAEQSWANYSYMVEQGLSPLPVYHYGEDQRFLERMLDAKIPYIGIGGLVGVPSRNRQLWLDRVFERITDEAGQPIVKTHGFGMTAVPLIFRYPWYSIDSTTWIKITASGSVYLPALRNDQFVFDEIPSTVSVSDRNPRQAQGGKHANSMSPAMRKILDRWLTFCGKTYDEVRESYYHRATCNVTFFREVSQAKTTKPFDKSTNRSRGLL